MTKLNLIYMKLLEVGVQRKQTPIDRNNLNFLIFMSNNIYCNPSPHHAVGLLVFFQITYNSRNKFGKKSFRNFHTLEKKILNQLLKRKPFYILSNMHNPLSEYFFQTTTGWISSFNDDDDNASLIIKIWRRDYF